jgi:hypothetical protein
MKRLLRRIQLIVLFAVMLFVGGSWIAAERLTRARQRPIGSPPKDFTYPAEAITFPSSDSQTVPAALTRNLTM